MDKQMLFARADQLEDRMFDLACRIFDRPEVGLEEYFAAELLTDALEKLGFTVERGIAGLPTAFRATWQQGRGGPHIGILGEYDALEGKGHGCGHHLQTPAAIAALCVLREALEKTGQSAQLTLYGTPAEEAGGGKVIMAEQGLFRELDAALATHSSRTAGFVSIGNLASHSRIVTFHGKSAHAAGSPWLGRSAMDAMLLTFQGLEFLREHVKDGTRIMYAIRQAIGPSNVVPQEAQCLINVRSPDNNDIPELLARMEKVCQGACLMTETTCDFQSRKGYMAKKPNYVLGQVALDNYPLAGIPVAKEVYRRSEGSSDVGNVSVLVPTLALYAPYVDAPSHSDAWVEAGKTEAARGCMRGMTRMLLAVSWDLIQNPQLLRQAKEEFNRT